MNINAPLNPNVSIVINYLNEKQVPHTQQIFDAPACSAEQAADLLSCPLGAIVKSLVFEMTASDRLLLALVSGQNRADLQKLSTLAREPVRVAAPKTVLAKTGFPVGAVPPCGLEGISQTYIDADLMSFQHVWASAGAENILVRLNPADLINLTTGKVETIKQM